MTDLHNAIMNIPAVPPKGANINQAVSYRVGHRDARHAAAELALASHAGAAEPTFFASAEQAIALQDSPDDSEGGVYLPLRKTSAGKFTMPLYAAPGAAIAACEQEPLLSDEEMSVLQRVEQDMQMFSEGRYPYDSNKMPNQKWRRATIADVERRFKSLVPRFAALTTKLMNASREEAPASEITTREFTNELGNRIRITIEGPTSVSENILTPMEARELADALATPPAAIPAAPSEAQKLCDLYQRLAEAMGYDSGEDGMEFSPEEWASALLRDATAFRALTQPTTVQQGEPSGWVPMSRIEKLAADIQRAASAERSLSLVSAFLRDCALKTAPTAEPGGAG